jgi:hypothetical protein
MLRQNAELVIYMKETRAIILSVHVSRSGFQSHLLAASHVGHTNTQNYILATYLIGTKATTTMLCQVSSAIRNKSQFHSYRHQLLLQSCAFN